jgi:hypothetical protein
MTEILSPLRIGIGPKGLGFKSGGVSFETRNGKYPKELIKQALKAAYNMKISVIAWHFFWDLSDKQDPAALRRWLGRWVFADDGVRISIRQQPLRKEEPVYYGNPGEKDLLLAQVLLEEDRTQRSAAILRQPEEMTNLSQLLWKFSILNKEKKEASLMNTEKERLPMKFSLVPLLLANRDIPAEARRALVENRLQDAAELLMHEYGLSCIEASDLLDVSAC